MYRKEILSYITSTFFVLLAMSLHLLEFFGVITFSVNAIVFFLYTAMILLWDRIMESRILRTQSKKYFRMIAFLMIGYLGARTLKYEILYDNIVAIKYIRYIYYLFSLNIIHLVFFISLMIAKSEREPISNWWHLLWIPTEVFVFLVLTNDFHGLAFSNDVSLGVDAYKPLFYIILIYAASLTIASLISVLIASRSMRSPWSVMLPILPMLLWILYTFSYVINKDFFVYIKTAIASAEFNILILILFIESLVFTRLIPSNRGYKKFLKLSSLNIGIMNMDGDVVFAPKEGPSVTPDMIRSSIGKAKKVAEDTYLESAKIKGGESFWFIDLKELNSLKKQLYALNESLMSENELLSADKKLKEKMAKLEEQNEIRFYIDSSLSDKFNFLKIVMNNLPEDEESFEAVLKRACITSAYIKRYSNLFLLSKKDKNIAMAELGLAFTESLNYLSLSGVVTKINWQSDSTLDIDLALAIYEVFQRILEVNYHALKAVDVNLVNDDEVEIKISADEVKTIGMVIEGVDMLENLHNGLWRISLGGSGL